MGTALPSYIQFNSDMIVRSDFCKSMEREPRIMMGLTLAVAISRTLSAEGVGFKPTDRRNLSTVFKTVPIDHSGTPPRGTPASRFEIPDNRRR